MLSRIYGVLLPFFVSFLLAYLLDPLVNFVQNKCRVKFRGLSVAIVLLLFVGLLTLSVYLLIPAIGRAVFCQFRCGQIFHARTTGEDP